MKITEMAPKVTEDLMKLNWKDVERIQAQFVLSGSKVWAGLIHVARSPDKAAAMTARKALKEFAPMFRGYLKSGGAAEQFLAARRSAGLTLRQFQKSVSILPQIAQNLTEAGIKAPIEIAAMYKKAPIWEMWKETFLTNPGDALNPFGGTGGRVALQWWRRNVFPVLSVVYDSVSNPARGFSTLVQDVGADVAEVVAGTPGAKMVRTKALYDTFGDLFKRRIPLPEKILQEFNPTAVGEKFQPFFAEKTTGVFFGKSTPIIGRFLRPPGSPKHVFKDTRVHFPLKWKTAVDTFNKKLGAMFSLREQAYKSAFDKGLKRGTPAFQDFVDDFISNPSAVTVNAAIARGNTIGFNVPLTALESKIVNSSFGTAMQLLVTPYPRWNMQFTHYLLEHSLVDDFTNPNSFWRKINNKTAKAEDFGKYIARSVQGLGFLKLVDNTIYDNVDFNTMQYVFMDENNKETSRMNISAFEPLVSPLFLIALQRGDYRNAHQALKASSTVAGPLALLYDDPSKIGIVGPIFGAVSKYIRGTLRDTDLRAMYRTVGAAIPYQAALRVLAKIFDPSIRTGFEANIPGLSRFEDPLISMTSDEPIKRQRFIGIGPVDFRDITRLPFVGTRLGEKADLLKGIGMPKGLPDVGIPGARKEIPLLERELLRLGITAYRRGATPLFNIAEADLVPEPARRVYEEEFRRAFVPVATQLINHPKWDQISPQIQAKELQDLIVGARTTARNMIDLRLPPGMVRQRYLDIEQLKLDRDVNPSGPARQKPGYLEKKR